MIVCTQPPPPPPPPLPKTKTTNNKQTKQTNQTKPNQTKPNQKTIGSSRLVIPTVLRLQVTLNTARREAKFSKLSSTIQSASLAVFIVVASFKVDLRPIYTVRFCRIQPPYDTLTTLFRPRLS